MLSTDISGIGEEMPQETGQDAIALKHIPSPIFPD
jgi:hypothetical protein